MNSLHRTHRSSAWLVALAALSGALVSPIAAPSPGETRSMRVSYADLNLATEDGATALYRRIQSAARVVCGAFEPGRDLSRQRAWNDCYESAVSNAVAQVNRPTLTALHREKIGGERTG